MPTSRCKCGAKYRYPESSIGKRAKCKKCGTIFTLKPEDNEGPIPIADDSVMRDEIAAAAARAKSAPASSPVSAAYLPSAESGGRLGRTVIEEAPAPTSYLRSLLSTLLFLSSIQNVGTFLIIWGALFAANYLMPAAGCLGLLGQVVVFGWYAAFRFGVIAEAAAGEKDLPALAGTEGVYDGIIVPLVKWLASWVIVFLPAYVYMLFALYTGALTANELSDLILGGVSGSLQGATAEMVPFVVLLCAGIFMWPMIVLCVTLGGFATLSRLDMLILTIIKTFPVYILTVALVFGADLLNGLLAGLATGRVGEGRGGYFLLGILVAGIGVYFEIVAMRIIGLYYHHFKQRFAWSWE